MDDVAQTIDLIRNPHAPYDVEQQAKLHNVLEAVRQAAAQEGQDPSAFVEMMRAGIETPSAPKRILLASALADLTGEARWFDLLFDEAGAPNVTFDDRHTLFAHIGLSLFMNEGKLAAADAWRLGQLRRRALFHQLVGEMDALLAASSFASAPARPVKDRVAILTPQYLAPPHATSLRALEYATALIETHGKTPVIVESHIQPVSSPIAFIPPFLSRVNRALRPIDTIEIAGRRVEYYRAASASFSLSELAHTVALVSALSPELVIAIGAPFISAEAVALRFPTFVQPTTAGLPITVRADTFSWDEPTAEERAVLAQFGVEPRLRFHMHPGFSLPPDGPAAARTNLGLPADAFVFAVVGNRLHDEVDAAFLDLLELIVAHPKAHVAMMGRFAGFDAAMALRPALAARVSFLGFREDILPALRACDAALNPDRVGGGRAYVYAQHAGLPVLTLGRGDVASALERSDCFGSYGEMAIAARRLIEEPAFREARSRRAQANAAAATGVGRLVSRILDETAR
jgi:glycosyltransferase involved in cell wall biosynthesis